MDGPSALKERWLDLLESFDLCFAWRLYTPLAHMMARRQWNVDVTALTPRVRAGRRHLPPMLPPRATIVAFLQQCGTFAQFLRGARQASSSVVYPRGKVSRGASAVSGPYSSRHLVAALRATQRVSSVRHATLSHSLQHLKLLCPQKWRSIEQELHEAGFEMPQYNALRRARVQLDVCAMLAHRQWSEGLRALFSATLRLMQVRSGRGGRSS